MRKMTKYALIGTMILIIIVPTVFFIVRGKKANDFYSNNQLAIQSNEIDSLVVDDTLLLAFTQGDNLFAREQKLTGEILAEHSLETINPVNIQLFMNNSQLFIVWESQNSIYLSDFSTISYFGEGEKPTVFENTNELFLCFIRNDYLYCHRMNQPGSLWIIDNAVSEYTITTTATTSYIAYNKQGLIHYRICNNLLWSQAKSFLPGANAVFVPGDNLTLKYLYYYANNSLNIGYGVDSLTHTKKIIGGDISYIQAYDLDPSLIIFTINGQMYIQEITSEETTEGKIDVISDYYFIANGFEPKVHSYRNLLIIVYRDGFNYYSLILSRDNKELFDFNDIKFDSLQGQEIGINDGFDSWYNNYNSYYSLIWEQQEWLSKLGSTGDWIIEHSFWASAILFIGGFIIVLVFFFAIPYLAKFLKKRKSAKMPVIG